MHVVDFNCSVGQHPLGGDNDPVKFRSRALKPASHRDVIVNEILIVNGVGEALYNKTLTRFFPLFDRYFILVKE